jgi:hypothetical protein
VFPDYLETTFRDLDTQLWQTRAFWQPVPFREPAPSWLFDHPGLAAALLALSDAELACLEASQNALWSWLAPRLPIVSVLPDLCSLPGFPTINAPFWPHGFTRDIPGRKWRQIEAFIGCLPATGQRLVDWCAGKGHLARAASWAMQQPARGLERDVRLCEAGESLAGRHGLPVSLACVDVFDECVQDHINGHSHCLALHACGDLHLRLMEVAVQQRVPALCFSPCCYHKGARVGTLNPDLSRLKPDRDMLRMAVQETVTAKGHERRQRDLEALWRQGYESLWSRLGLCALPRHTTLPVSEFRGSFEDFCLRRLAEAGITVPARLEPSLLDECLVEGTTRLARLRRLELLRHAWRRPLEVWLCLDRALWLARRGYAVEVGTFCEASLTPRNILLRAQRIIGPEYPCGDGPGHSSCASGY